MLCILQGDHVKVIGGRFEGDTGLIVRVQENMIVLFSDVNLAELKVLPRDLQLCSDMATGVDSLGQFQFGDMVQLDPQTVGVIVQIQKENFQVLNMHGKVSGPRIGISLLTFMFRLDCGIFWPSSSYTEHKLQVQLASGTISRHVSTIDHYFI